MIQELWHWTKGLYPTKDMLGIWDWKNSEVVLHIRISEQLSAWTGNVKWDLLAHHIEIHSWWEWRCVCEKWTLQYFYNPRYRPDFLDTAKGELNSNEKMSTFEFLNMENICKCHKRIQRIMTGEESVFLAVLTDERLHSKYIRDDAFRRTKQTTQSEKQNKQTNKTTQQTTHTGRIPRRLAQQSTEKGKSNPREFL